MADEAVQLPGAILRANNVDVLGRAVFHAPLEVRRDAYRQLTEYAAKGDIAVSLEEVPLSRVADAWERQRAGAGTKLVLVP